MTTTTIAPRHSALIKTAKKRAKSRYYQMSSMTSEQRLTDFLGRCTQQGVHSTKGRFPTLTQLSNYCRCNPSTINRIASGQTRNPDRQTMTILFILAGVCPHARLDDSLFAEIAGRVADAERWRRTGSFDLDGLIETMQEGIRKRARKKAKAQAARQKATQVVESGSGTTTASN